MPNWKKLITSGSNASLASLNVSNAITGSALTISGNAGIGTASPSSKFEVSDSSSSTNLRITTTAGTGNRYSQLQFMDGSTQNSQVYQNHNDGNYIIRNNTANGSIILLTNDTANTLTFDSTGKVGIGTSPSHALQVEGTITGSRLVLPVGTDLWAT